MKGCWCPQRGSTAIPELVSSSTRPRRLGPQVTCSMICRKWCLKVAVFSSSYSQPRASAAWFAHSNRMNCFRPTVWEMYGSELLGMGWVGTQEDLGGSHHLPPSRLPTLSRSLNNCPGLGSWQMAPGQVSVLPIFLPLTCLPYFLAICIAHFLKAIQNFMRNTLNTELGNGW